MAVYATFDATTGQGTVQDGAEVASLAPAAAPPASPWPTLDLSPVASSTFDFGPGGAWPAFTLPSGSEIANAALNAIRAPQALSNINPSWLLYGGLGVLGLFVLLKPAAAPSPAPARRRRR